METAKARGETLQKKRKKKQNEKSETFALNEVRWNLFNGILGTRHELFSKGRVVLKEFATMDEQRCDEGHSYECLSHVHFETSNDIVQQP